MSSFLASLPFVVLAEMGDKTQLLAGAAAVLARWLPLAGTALVVFGLGVLTLGAAHALLIQRRCLHARAIPARHGVADRLPQSLFALLLLVAWVASLGLAKPLAAVDHWITFVFLAGLGWKLIHGAVRPGRPAARVNARLLSLILPLAAITSAQAYLAAFPLALAIVPVAVLLAGVAVLIGAPLLVRGTASEPLQRIGQHRLVIAAGLILIGIALQVVHTHLA
jgi:putative Mn2+ efflux pump MntP